MPVFVIDCRQSAIATPLPPLPLRQMFTADCRGQRCDAIAGAPITPRYASSAAADAYCHVLMRRQAARPALPRRS